MEWDHIFDNGDGKGTIARQNAQKREIINLLATSSGEMTIPEICRRINLSIPTGTKLINELKEQQVITSTGKRETGNGRKPVIYSLNPSSLYAVGVEVLMRRISVGIVDLKFNTVFYKRDKNFRINDNEESLEYVKNFINQTIEEAGIESTRILGIGIGLTGRVNIQTGIAYNYFRFLDEPLSKYFSRAFHRDVFIDNDTHIWGYAEKILGRAREASNALVVNLGRGLGMSIIVNGQMVTGSSGFAGEFGHMQFGDSNKLCICGKHGCLGMDVSGFAVEEKFKMKIEQGESSILARELDLDQLRYDDILEAAARGDALSITLIQQTGNHLGKALGNIINLLNPEVIVLGGKFARAESLLLDSVRSGMIHSALPNPLKNVKLELSDLDEKGGVRGAGAMVFKQYSLI
jgi:predicted NBD/HSP70 family sugar kinase/predicted transcriptional regulator